MSGSTSTVERSIAAAAAAAADLVDHCIERATADLQEAESRAMSPERQRIADAWRALLQQRLVWRQRFPRLLSTAIAEEARGTAEPAPVAADPPTSSSGFLEFSLVDDTEIASRIESTRLAEQLNAMLERPLAELDGLMSSALGLDVVRPERNPLRPAVYAQVLRKLMAESATEPGWTALWVRAMVQPLAQQLEPFYRAQVEGLTRAQVHAAQYRVVMAPSSPSSPSLPSSPSSPAAGAVPGGATAPGAAPAAGAPFAGDAPGETTLSEHAGFADLPARALESPRLQQFLLRGEAQAQRPLAPAFYVRAEAELRALQALPEGAPYDPRAARQHMHLPAVERPARHVDTASPLPPETWGAFAASRERALVRGRLKAEAREAGQVFGLEVVRRLVDRVADDPRLLAPLREAIVGLEPSLSRLAMVAPRFFSDEAHPGRLLVEKVAERSFKFNDEYSVEFQGFYRAVAQAFQRLNQVEQLESAEPFRAALANLQAGWQAQDELDAEAERKVLEAVQLAERRQQEAERIASEFDLREDLAHAPEPVRAFVLATWSLVVANARLEQPNAVDPGGHLSVLGELLWSVDRDQTLKEPARAFERIPRVLQGLRAGLESLGQQPAESDTFFRQLELLHRPVLKLRAKHRHRDLAPPEPIRIADAASEAAALEDEHPWMAPEELRAAGFEDTVPSGFAQLATPRAMQAPAATLDDAQADHLLAMLQTGDWVDLYSRQQWRRARLVWAAARGTLFMFTSHGGQPHSMSRRSLRRLLKERLLRPVESDAVVPRALARLGEASAPMPLAA
ncbi:MAG: DUF1631 family protein [Ramlibacter sp.]